MKLGVFMLWTEMREQKPSAAFEVSPQLFSPATTVGAPVAPKATKARAAQKAAVSKRKPPVIVDEITAS